MRKLASRIEHVAEPGWVGFLMLGVALMSALLALLLEGGRYEQPGALGNLTPLSAALTGVYLLAWFLEILGFLGPRWLFAALTLIPTGGLLYLGRDTLAPLLPMLVGWWLAYTGSRRQALLGLLLVLASIVPPFVTGRGEFDNWVSWSIGCVFSWTSGVVLALQRRTLAALRAAQADLARQAALEERRRLAGELHDLVAHTLAVTMLHLTGARHVLQRDPTRAAEALAQAEELGRQSLADLRRAVGLMADEPRAPQEEPNPGAADIPALAEAFAQAGMPLSVVISGPLEHIPPGLGLDLYRMTQEALSNAARHAPGDAVRLELAVEPTVVSLRVHNELRQVSAGAGSAGRGLVGMRARAVSHRGTLNAGRDGAGWLVQARLPINGAPLEPREVQP